MYRDICAGAAALCLRQVGTPVVFAFHFFGRGALLFALHVYPFFTNRTMSERNAVMFIVKL